MAEPTKKQALILSLQEARGQLASNISGIRRDLSVGQRFRRSVKQRPFVWFAGAAVLGLLLAKIPPIGGRKVVVQQPVVYQKSAGKAALFLTALKFLLDLGKPALAAWAAKRIKDGAMPEGRYRPERATASRFR
jgi:hypothetical protein